MILLILMIILFVVSTALLILHTWGGKFYDKKSDSFDLPEEYYSWDLEKRNKYHSERNAKKKAWQDSRLYDITHWCYRNDPIAQGVISIFSVIILFIMLIIAIVNVNTFDAVLAQNQARYDIIVYQLENDIYNDNGDDVVGKRDLYEQVREWNEDYAYKKRVQDNPWTGIFIPNYCDYLKPIEINTTKGG